MFKVALYLRLSQEDGERGIESESIANQREFLLQYAAGNGLTVKGIYIDDGWSGTSFDRPDFRRMIADIERGEIDTVITKDLSRLGRDYILTGHYLERYFPERGVRYIAVNDNIDTAVTEGAIRIAPFLSVVNDMYAQDISRKVRGALNAKKKTGRFIGSAAPYGYAKSQNDRGKLVVDEEPAAAVREIFRDYLENGSLTGAAKKLTERGVPTPSEYKCLSSTQKRFSGVWNAQTVKRILTNPTYAGHLTQNRARKVSHKVDKKINLPPEEWIIVPNTHEPIVGQEDFCRVQEMLKVRAYTRAESGGHLLTGLAYCADCGSAMTYVKESAKRTYMVCQGYRIGGRLRLCTSHTMREDAVIRAVCETLMELARGLIDDSDVNAALQAGLSNDRLKKRLRDAETKLESVKKAAFSLYMDKVSGEISELEYLEMKESVRGERQRLEDQAAEIEARLFDSRGSEEMRRYLKGILEFDEPARATIVTLVERIVIRENKDIEMHLRFSGSGKDLQKSNQVFPEIT